MPDDDEHQWKDGAGGEGAEFLFVDGALQVISGERRMSVVGWPQPRAMEVRAGAGRWQPFVPTFRLVAPYRPAKKKRSRQVRKDSSVGQLGFDFSIDAGRRAVSLKPEELSPAQKRRRAFDGFRFSLPKPVARALERFRSQQWAPLLMLRHDAGAVELMQANAVLGFALAHRMGGDVELFASLQVGRMRQRDLLALLELPDSAAAAKWVAKVPPESVSGQSWAWLERLLRETAGNAELAKTFSHLPSLNLGVVSLLEDEVLRRRVSMNLLREVAEAAGEKYEARVAGRLTQVAELLLQADATPVEMESLRIDSVSALDVALLEARERWQEAQRRRAELRASGRLSSGKAFPLPPVPGRSGMIEPLESLLELHEEGQAQDNCVASYADRVRHGSTYIYRIKSPQRATLSLVRDDSGDWRVGELEVAGNVPVKASTRAFVDEWLARYRISA